MGIFKPKISDEERLNRGLLEEIERKRDNLNDALQVYESAQPIIKKYAQCFEYATFMMGELSLAIKEDVQVDPQIFCDAGKYGLNAIQERGHFYGSNGYIKIKLL